MNDCLGPANGTDGSGSRVRTSLKGSDRRRRWEKTGFRVTRTLVSLMRGEMKSEARRGLVLLGLSGVTGVFSCWTFCEPG